MRPPRPPGARPELLDRIKTPFLTSPPMFAVGFVFVLLYGLVLAGVVSNYRNRPIPVELPPRGGYAIASTPTGPATDAARAAAEKEKEKEKEKEAEKQKESDKEKAAAGDKKPERGKDGSRSRENSDDRKDRNSGGKASDNPDRDKPAPKVEVALNVPPPKPVPVAPKTVFWEMLGGDPGDCQFLPDASGLTIKIPGTIHVMSPFGIKNSPHLLADAGGDFTAEVQVVGKMSPGNVPLDTPEVMLARDAEGKRAPAMKFPMTFQSAGLILWQDENNYVRLERESIFNVLNPQKAHGVLLEVTRNGQIVSSEERPARESLKNDRGQPKEPSLSLKMERSGSELRCWYSQEGPKNWIEVKRYQGFTLPPVVKVGVSASNISARAFPARFEKFELSAKVK